MTTNAATPGRVGAIYTGGTFGMVRSPEGYVPSTDLPERVGRALADSAPDLPAPQWLDGGLGPPVNSSDITPRYWYALAEVIRQRADDFDGFVVIHGTDTLAFTASALSFLLADLAQPVIVTGARAPLGEAGSDAVDNLAGALRVAAGGRPAEVGVAFAGHLLRGNRTSKRFGDRETVFASPNAAPLARLDGAIEWRDRAAVPAERLPASTFRGQRVALLPVYPGLDGDSVRRAAQGADALLLEAYPSGVGPGGDADFVAAVRETVDAGVIVAAVPQNQHGHIRMGRYATSTPLAAAGLLGGADLTREAALAKLHYLLGTGMGRDEVARALVRNLRGELTETGEA